MTSPETPLPPYFQQLPRQEAKEFLQRFVAEIPASRDRLAGMLGAAGADPDLAHDLSPGALDPLWAAAQGWEVGWQEGYVAPPTRSSPPVSTPTMGAMGPVDRLPSWFVHDRHQSLRYSPDTLWVIDVLARHLGEVVLAEHPHLRWTLGPARPANNVDRNYPVVGTAKGWVNPIRVVSGLVERRIWGKADPHAPATLRALYDRQTTSAPDW